MQLPRRVPWESLAELEQVCAWIYTDENDLEAKERAVNRLAAWRASVPLPHALESAHAILSVLLQDGTAASSSTCLSLRMSYASAIIRLVNGLVDPLQLGAYARSIHSIAQQLGLPAWLVELRHAATHEDLPSLEVLRDAAREVMAWLMHNYFLPTLNPSTPSADPAPPLRPLAPLLRQYKTFLKATTRDATLHVQYRAEITKTLRDVERWIAEAKVASSSAAGGVAWDDAPDDGGDDSQEDAREKWALDRLSEVLLEKGMLVPLSKKKRVSPDQASLALPRSSAAIWSPLLTHLQSLHPILPLHLVSAITAHLSRPISPETAPNTDFGADTVSLSLSLDQTSDELKTDPSYDLCLASWAKWLVDNCTGGIASAAEAADFRESILVRIVAALRPDRIDGGSSKAAIALLQLVSAERPKLAAALSILVQNPAQPSSSSTQNWDEEALGLMDTRLHALLALQRTSARPDDADGDSDTAMPDAASAASVQEDKLPLPPGWRKLRERDGWGPAPIGVFVACP